MFFPLTFFLSSSLLCLLTARSIKSHPKKIRDLCHIYLPHINQKYLSDIMVLFSVLWFLCVTDKSSLQDAMIIVGMCQCLRAITISSTILPHLKHYNQKHRFGGINGFGTEYIFSGHAVYSCVCTIYLFLLGYLGLLSAVIYNLVSQLLIILSHNHYTVDVILSWIIAPSLYFNLQYYKLLQRA